MCWECKKLVIKLTVRFCVSDQIVCACFLRSRDCFLRSCFYMNGCNCLPLGMPLVKNTLAYFASTHEVFKVWYIYGRGLSTSILQKWKQEVLYKHRESITNEINILRPRRNGQHFADDNFKPIFFSENVWISIKFSPKFATNGSINNIPAVVRIMAWRRPRDKPLSEPMMVSLLTHICVTRPCVLPALLSHVTYNFYGMTPTVPNTIQKLSCHLKF